MSYYVIGIGGTGAKCVESFIQLCAAGLMPDSKPVSCLFVDPDGANGNLNRTTELLRNYARCRLLRRGTAELFKSELRISTPDVWSPFRDRPPRLQQFFSSGAMTGSPAAHLFDVLYTPKEKNTSLEFGFRGHPSIGAAVMAATVKFESEAPWTKFFEDIRLEINAGQIPRVLLLGSIFGGTGAAGVPTLSRLIANQFAESLKARKLKLGSVLMLPYFSFDSLTHESLRVDADTFLLSTQAALQYYDRQDELKLCNNVYLLGDDFLTPLRHACIGGESQKNEPHLQELFAALGAIHFFEGVTDEDGYPCTARASKDRTQWTDLPYSKGTEHLKAKIDQLARFAFSFLTSYHPTLTSIYKEGGAYRAPWYVDLLDREGVDLEQCMEHELGNVVEICRSYLLWLAHIEYSRSAGNGGHPEGLINVNAFAERAVDENGKPLIRLRPPEKFDRSAFGNLLLPVKHSRPKALSRLWERMSDTRVEDVGATGVGRFIRALYDECGSPALIA